MRTDKEYCFSAVDSSLNIIYSGIDFNEAMYRIAIYGGPCEVFVYGMEHRYLHCFSVIPHVSIQDVRC